MVRPRQNERIEPTGFLSSASELASQSRHQRGEAAKDNAIRELAAAPNWVILFEFGYESGFDEQITDLAAWIRSITELALFPPYVGAYKAV
jgi:hypothetical protein